MKDSFGRKLFLAANNLFMLFMICITLYPFLYIIFASLSDSGEMMKHTGLLFYPLKANLNSYAAVFKNKMIFTGYRNTLIIMVLGLTINMLMTVLGAYVLSRKELVIRKPMMIFITITMFISGGLIPSYNLVKGLGLLDSIWALILPGALSTFNLIIMRTNFEGIPRSLEESASLDGAGDMTLLFKIIIPLTLPAMAVILLYYAVGIWNSWFNAMIYLKNRDLYPLQLIMREILIGNETSAMEAGIDVGDKQSVSETIKYAVIIVSTLPILVVYPFLQKYFVKGTLAGAVKG